MNSFLEILLPLVNGRMMGHSENLGNYRATRFADGRQSLGRRCFVTRSAEPEAFAICTLQLPGSIYVRSDRGHCGVDILLC
jgi:hypothetical protein